MATSHSRRALLGWIGVSCLTGTALHALGEAEEFDPADLVPRRFTPEEFAAQTPEERYKTNLAVRRGRSIRIDGCTVSQSRSIIRQAASNPAQALQMLRQHCNS